MAYSCLPDQPESIARKIVTYKCGVSQARERLQGVASRSLLVLQKPHGIEFVPQFRDLELAMKSSGITTCACTSKVK